MKKVTLARRSSAAFESALPVAAEKSNPGASSCLTSATLSKYKDRVATFELIDTLRSVDLFSGLSDDDHETLARALEKSEYKRKQWVFRQGEAGDRFYIIVEGEAQVLRSVDGREDLLKTCGEGDFFGERALLKSEPRFAGVKCISPVLRTLSIDKAAFERLLGPLEDYVKRVEYAAPPAAAAAAARRAAGGASTSFAAGRPASGLRRASTIGASTLGAGLRAVEFQTGLRIRRHRAVVPEKKHQAKSLIEGGRPPANGRHATFADIMKADEQRKKLLTLAREINPIDSIVRMAALPRTVIPRIAQHMLTWAVLMTYATACVLTRCGVEFGMLDLTSFDASNTLITFMIIFYVGYCYSRYTAQFEDVEGMMQKIIDSCIMARVTFRDPATVLRLWRYLNLLQAAAYTGLSPAYTEANFFLPMCKRHDLLPKHEAQKASEAGALDAISNGDGAAACNAFQIWALDLVQQEAMASNSKLSAPVHALLNRQILDVGQAAKRLHAYTYQVLPFIYTHLVSLMCTLYLLFNAFIKGLYFEPEASWTFGLILPLCSMLTTTLAVFGLLEVGDTILDPFGCDPEDFTVLHFIEWTISSSLAAIETEQAKLIEQARNSSGEASGEHFYSPEETAAMVKVVARMVARHRARKAAAAAAREKVMQSAMEHEEARRRPRPRPGTDSFASTARSTARSAAKPRKAALGERHPHPHPRQEQQQEDHHHRQQQEQQQEDQQEEEQTVEEKAGYESRVKSRDLAPASDPTAADQMSSSIRGPGSGEMRLGMALEGTSAEVVVTPASQSGSTNTNESNTPPNRQITADALSTTQATDRMELRQEAAQNKAAMKDRAPSKRPRRKPVAGQKPKHLKQRCAGEPASASPQHAPDDERFSC